MRHFTIEQWEWYIAEELTDEERLAYEIHLGSCDSCLELYMQSLEKGYGFYPQLGDGISLAEAVMDRIQLGEAPFVQASASTAFPTESEQPRTRPNWMRFCRHPVFHYTVAAAITLLLMSSGVFQSLSDRLGMLNTDTQAAEAGPQQQEGRLSVSYKLMEKTIVMLDSIQPKHDKGGAR